MPDRATGKRKLAAARKPSPTRRSTGRAAKRTLVVYYSRTGYTRRIAELLAQKLDADLEQIATSGGRTGPLGFLRCMVDSLLERRPSIEAPKRMPRGYDTVVVGTPVWVGHVAGPVRTYLLQHASEFHRLGLFCTLTGANAREALSEMAALVQDGDVETIDPDAYAMLALTGAEIDGSDLAKVDPFIDALRALPRDGHSG